MRITRADANQDALKAAEAELPTADKLILDRVVYRKISSLTDNKVLQMPEGKDSEFDRFLINMENIHCGECTNEAVIAMDQYLGELGVTKTYPFPDDTYNIPNWIEYSEEDHIRNVVSGTDNVVAGSDNIIHIVST